MTTVNQKVLLYKGSEKVITQSGIGEALRHQKQMLASLKVSYTEDPKDDYDIVHLNTVLPDSVSMAKRAKKNGKKVIYYGHSTMEDFKNSFSGSNLVAPLFKQWLRYCYQHGDMIITPTDYSKHLLLQYDLNRPIVSLSNGVDTTYFVKNTVGGERFRKQYHLSEDQKVVVSVGHLIERKGIVEFLTLAQQFPSYVFFWFGHTAKSLMTRRVQKAIAHAPANVRFPGYVSPTALRDAYSGSDLFLFMTYEETEGIVLLEALANEIPVLVRDIPIYKDWLPDREVVYKAKTQDDFSHILPQLLEGQLPSLTHEARLAAEKLDIKNIGHDLAIIYTKLFSE
ncbi:glycosyltransferase family 4 protein [Marinilactibacillus kalidii]|uniref:glycosyltransferase family 4 protein n=1 Tax=Marinilactibacillus kalidii TaxID=2820274 RepID=UPI001ABDB88D|nr:glycosyltransferase family 4 protein [Marinilactibacillus kalidii]